MRYTIARSNEEYKLHVYRSYVCDSLQNIPQNQYITTTYADLIKPKKVIDVKKVVNDVIEKGGLVARG